MPSGGESGAVWLIQTACSAFQKRGNQAAGQSADFLAYINELGEPLKLIQMEGNRFNVIFHNGAAVYYHLLHMRKMLEEKISELKRKKINLTLKLETIGGLWRFEKLKLHFDPVNVL